MALYTSNAISLCSDQQGPTPIAMDKFHLSAFERAVGTAMNRITAVGTMEGVSKYFETQQALHWVQQLSFSPLSHPKLMKRDILAAVA